MEKTIYNTYIRVTSQEQCDRLKQVCVENGLRIWKKLSAFEFLIEFNYDIFQYSSGEDFFIDARPEKNYTEVTESEWMELLKQDPLSLQQRIDKALEYLESFNEEDRNQYLINILRYGKRMD